MMQAFIFLLLLLGSHAFYFVHHPAPLQSVRLRAMPVRIAIDYAPKQIGVAISDELGNISPYGRIFNNGNMTDTSIKVIDMAILHRAKEILVGFPVDRNGRIRADTKNFNGRMCYNFTKVLSTTAASYAPDRFVIKAVDESYTTREATYRIQSREYSGSIDSVAAACILEHYIADHGEMSMEILPSNILPGGDRVDYQQMRETVTKYKRKEFKYNCGGDSSVEEKIVKLVQPVRPDSSPIEKERHDKHIEFFKWYHSTETPLNFQRNRTVLDFTDPEEVSRRIQNEVRTMYIRY